MDLHHIVVEKGQSGYGFCVKGSHPAFVSRVTPSGAADMAGLQVGDRIIQLNYKLVQNSFAEDVCRTMKKCDRIVLMADRPLWSRKIKREKDSQSNGLKECISQLMSPQCSNIQNSSTQKTSSEKTGQLLPAQNQQRSMTMYDNNFALMESNNNSDAVHELIRCEECFVRTMDFGVLPMLVTLRPNLTAEQHETVFGNLKQLVELSRTHLIALHTAHSPDAQDVIALYYADRAVTCNGYAVLYRSVRQSTSLLRALCHDNGPLKTYVEALMNGDYEVLKPALEHFGHLTKHMKSVVAMVPAADLSGYKGQAILQAMMNVCETFF